MVETQLADEASDMASSSRARISSSTARRRLSAKAVVVLGKVSGNIQASELVRIGETGSVEGAIAASRLVVAVGATLAGPRGRAGLGLGATFAVGPPPPFRGYDVRV